MTRHLLFLLLCSWPALAGDPKLNGRWDIQVFDPRQMVAWWLEISGAETASPAGRFVGAPSGQMDTLRDLSIDGGRIRFSLPEAGAWTASLEGGRLHGSHVAPGEPEVKWEGRHAPSINDRDDGSWRQGKPVSLFDRRDLSGWRAVTTGKSTGWAVKDGLMTNQGGAENIVSAAKFWNFVLHAEFRLEERSNSGIGLRGRYEVQIMNDYRRPITGHSTAGVYGRILPAANVTRAPGEWQTYDIRLVGRQVTVVFNGVKVIDKKEIEGLTAIAVDPDEGEPGPIALQGDHGSIEFRDLTITPLVR
jgi:hypothetical protein